MSIHYNFLSIIKVNLILSGSAERKMCHSAKCCFSARVVSNEGFSVALDAVKNQKAALTS